MACSHSLRARLLPFSLLGASPIHSGAPATWLKVHDRHGSPAICHWTVGLGMDSGRESIIDIFLLSSPSCPHLPCFTILEKSRNALTSSKRRPRQPAALLSSNSSFRRSLSSVDGYRKQLSAASLSGWSRSTWTLVQIVGNNWRTPSPTFLAVPLVVRSCIRTQSWGEGPTSS